jgi:hypothetical protein
MSTEMLCRAIADRRFKGARRLCWFAFGDGGGVTGLSSVMYWAGCDEQEAENLLNWFVRNGFARRQGEHFVCYEFQVARDRIAVMRPSRPKMSKAKRRRVIEAHGAACVYCGAQDEALHIDHIVPLSRGGRNDDGNLAPACARCNLSKGSKTLEEWRD